MAASQKCWSSYSVASYTDANSVGFIFSAQHAPASVEQPFHCVLPPLEFAAAVARRGCCLQSALACVSLVSGSCQSRRRWRGQGRRFCLPARWLSRPKRLRSCRQLARARPLPGRYHPPRCWSGARGRRATPIWERSGARERPSSPQRASGTLLRMQGFERPAVARRVTA